jgi:streptogramin lyase
LQGRRRASLLLVACGWLAACGGPSVPAAGVTPPASPPASPPGSTATPAASPAPASPTAAPAATVGFDQLTVLHRFATAPDDVAVDSAGHIWVSSRSAGRIDELGPGGSELASFPDPNGPEGIVALADGRVVVAEQGPNRLVLLDPATGSLSPLVSIPNPTGNFGVDGIALSADGTQLLVPDSPSGRLLEVPIGGGSPIVLASGLGRPVAAGQLGDGTVVVASEGTPGLETAAGGAVHALGGLSDLDEATPLGGLVYVTALGSGQVDAVDPASGASRVLVTGSPSPQGLAALPGGRLLLVDSTRQALVELPACS